MDSLFQLITYLLTASGLTILMVWPETGPSAWVREKILRSVMSKKVEGVLDCYVCFGFWGGLMLAPLWKFYFEAEDWVWAGCFMVSFVFWLLVRGSTDDSEE